MEEHTINSFQEFADFIANLPFKQLFRGEPKSYPTLLPKIARTTEKQVDKIELHCLELFRQALLKNYTADSLLFLEFKDPKFSIEKFAPFIHQNNIFEITSAIEEASYHIERNGNAKLIFSDLSIQLTRLIHKTESA